MKRLGIVAAGLALVVAVAFCAGAFALFVWPGDEPEEAPGIAAPRYTLDEVIGIVRVALDHEGRCSTGPLPQHTGYNPRWGASFDEQSGKWLVGAFCDKDKEEGPPIDFVPPGAATWKFVEDTGQVIPMNDLAAELMRPR